MKLRLLLTCLLCCSLIRPYPLQAQGIRIAIIPLTFHSKEDLSGLREPLMTLLNKGLRQQGFYPVPATGELEEAMRKQMSDALARQLGKDLGCSFALWGSFNKIGDHISLDVRLVDVGKRRPTVPIYVSKTGLENLASAVADLAQEISIRILKKEKVHQILVRGNRRIEDAAIKLVIKSKPGDLFEPEKLREDLTAVHQMGYFKDVRIEAEDTSQGKDVIFVVEEKPTIEKVEIRGARAISKEDIRTAIATKRYAILQRATLKSDVEKIKRLYRDKGYYNAEVSYSVEPLQENTVGVTFDIDEHEKLYIREISFSGNHEFSDDKLRDVIKTSEKGFFSWLTESGILKSEELEVDTDRLAGFYHNHGFIDAKVGKPVVTYDQEGIYIEFPVSEGRRFRVGEVKVEVKDESGEPPESLVNSLKLPRQEYFNREMMARDLESITDYYTSRGYAFAEVTPRMNKDESQQVVDVTYEVNPGEVVYFNRITISGNTKTRDKVIRRELKVVEQGRYSKSKLERSVRNLQRLDYFEQVEMDTSRAEAPDEMNLNVEVKEKPTSFISFGGGYSSADQAFLMGQIAERNLFGRGQNLQFQGIFGGISSRFSLKFTEPWLFDIPLSATTELYRWYRDYDEFEKKSTGGRLSFSYPVWDYTRIYFSYGYEDATVEEVAATASHFIREQEGNIVSSVVSTVLRRDSRDHPFLVTRGSDNSVSVDYAGGVLGGDATYAKIIFNSSWYFPLFWKCVGFLHGKTGYITDTGDGIVPIYERFFLGGINSIRAFDSGDVGPRDPETGDRIGGNKMALFNAEFLFPLVEQHGIRGVLFYDAGDAFDNGEPIEISEFRTAAGAGVRWYSPMGPLRLEWGYNLDPEPGESQSNWQFSMGVFF